MTKLIKKAKKAKNRKEIYEFNTENGSFIPKDKKKITFEHRPYIAVQDNTYVAPKVIVPFEKKQFNPREQPVLRADTRTEQERKVAQEYTESVLNPSISRQIGEAFQKPLRWLEDPVKGVGDIVSAIAPNSALAKDLPNTNEDELEYRKKQLNPYTSNKEKLNNTINEVTPLTIWALLNTLPIGAIGGNMIKPGKNLIKHGVGKSTPSLIKKGVKSTGELLNKPVQNAYKLNPWAFKPSSNNLYRGLGESGVKDAFETGVLRPRPVELKHIGKDIVTDSGETFRLKGKTFDKTYYSPEFKIADRYGNGYIAEVPKNSATFNNRYSTRNDWSMHTTEQIPIDKSNILKKDWLTGYKKINAPKKQFKSEINWGKWNKEIPNNKALMKEYEAIEKSSKANGTWMKNPDGTDFPGTPEQFVQQNSSNFKKAFPDEFEITFRGAMYNYPDQGRFNYLFSGDKKVATNKHYTVKNPTLWKPTDEIGKEASKKNGGLYELFSNKPDLNIDAKKSNFHAIDFPDIAKNYKNSSGSDRFVSTDNIADHMIKNDINGININNVLDESLGNIKITNTKLSPVKSRWYNNGMFDMTNPNIYKGLIPPALMINYLKSKTNEDEKSNL